MAADDGKTLKVSGVASDGEFWISKALTTVEMLKNDTKHVALLEDVDEDVERIRTLARHTADTLKQVPDTLQEAAQGAELLLLAGVLHQYSADEEGTDTAVLEVGMVSDARKSPDADDLQGLRRRYNPYVCFWRQKEQEIADTI